MVTTTMAFIIQMIPAILNLWSRSAIWGSWVRKLLGVAVALFVPLSSEVWLNSVNSYTFLAGITFLILLEEPPSDKIRRWVYRILLFISGLTGTLSCFLLPLFTFRGLDEKDRERWRQMFI